MSAIWRNGVPAAGLVCGPLAALIGQTAAYALTPLACGGNSAVLPPVTAAAIAMALGGAVLSWRGLAANIERAGDGGAPRRFLALAGVLVSLLFAGVIVLQGAAPAVVGPCLR